MSALRLGVVACLLCVAALVAGSASPPSAGHSSLRVLQLNLCDSGIAGCYTGRAVAEAAKAIRATRPDVVGLNEVCQDDVSTLADVFAQVHGQSVASAFQAAPDRRTGAATICVNGRDYGIGLLVRGDLSRTYGGIYPVQDLGDPEIRVWLCINAIGSYLACTTHLASTNADVALAQCRHLLATEIPVLHHFDGYSPTVLAGDFNLRDGATPDLAPCVPPGYWHLSDGGVQHILATSDFTTRSATTTGLNGATDHAALLATLAMAGKPSVIGYSRDLHRLVGMRSRKILGWVEVVTYGT